MRRQAEAGIDIPSDGEFGKAISWSQYALERLSGFERRPAKPGANPFSRGADRTRFAEFYAEEHGSRAPSSDEGPARVTTHIRVQAAANSPVAQPARPVGALAKLGAALALGVGASIGLGFLRRR